MSLAGCWPPGGSQAALPQQATQHSSRQAGGVLLTSADAARANALPGMGHAGGTAASKKNAACRRMLLAAVGLQQRFPRFPELALERMKLTQHDLINIASLIQLTKLELR